MNLALRTYQPSDAAVITSWLKNVWEKRGIASKWERKK